MGEDKERYQQQPVSETDLKLFALTADKTKVDLTGPDDGDSGIDEEKIEVMIEPDPPRVSENRDHRRSHRRSTPQEQLRAETKRTSDIFQREVEQELRKRDSTHRRSTARLSRDHRTSRDEPKDREDERRDEHPPEEDRYEERRYEEPRYDENSDEVKREKMEYLRELKNMEASGISLAKNYSMSDSLADLKYELEHHRRRKTTKERVKWILNAMKMVFHLVEQGNASYGPFLHLDNWAKTITADMSQFEEPVETLYLQYFGKRGSSNPWFQILFIIGSSIFMHHLQYKLGHGTVLSSAPPPASSRPAPPPQPTPPQAFTKPQFFQGNSPPPPPPSSTSTTTAPPPPPSAKRAPLQPPKRPGVL